MKKRSTGYDEKVSTVKMQIAERSVKHSDRPLTNLSQFIDAEFLRACFYKLNRRSAAGVDEQTWTEYAEEVDQRISGLLSSFKEGTYKAPPVRRTYIQKEDGSQRPLGIPTIEDKILQKAVYEVMTPVYETMFYPSSYGFRPSKSQHQAIDQLFKEVSFGGVRYIIDADIKNYFGTIDFALLREFLDLRIIDGVIRKMLDKWLKAGVQEEHQLSYPDMGTPQGGTISPLLSNLYLHYVLDEWFFNEVQPRLAGKSFLIRYADDFVLGFTDATDAQRVMAVLFKRFAKYKITLHPEKTKLIDLDGDTSDHHTFDFLGFTHYMSPSRRGKRVLKRKTSRRKLKGSFQRITAWIREHRHVMTLEQMIRELNRKLLGYYEYYGITFNSRSLQQYFHGVCRRLFYWMNRRGGAERLSWSRFNLRISVWSPLRRPTIRHSYC